MCVCVVRRKFKHVAHSVAYNELVKKNASFLCIRFAQGTQIEIFQSTMSNCIFKLDVE